MCDRTKKEKKKGFRELEQKMGDCPAPTCSNLFLSEVRRKLLEHDSFASGCSKRTKNKQNVFGTSVLLVGLSVASAQGDLGPRRCDALAEPPFHGFLAARVHGKRDIR
jgi:hypothetical protein